MQQMDRYLTYSPAGVGKRIRDARKEANLTQEELSDKCGLGQSAISSLELGNVKAPEAHTILCLAAALKKTPRWLMYGQEQPDWSKPQDVLMGELWHALTPEERAKMVAYGQGLIDARGPRESSARSQHSVQKKGHH